MERICRNCHFLAKEYRDALGKVYSFSLDEAERADLGKIKDHYSLKCQMGVWDEGVAPHSTSRTETIYKTPRKDLCFFWPYQPNMLFDAARELQKRDQENRELKRSHFYTRIGLFIAAAGLVGDVLLRLFLHR